MNYNDEISIFGERGPRREKYGVGLSYVARNHEQDVINNILHCSETNLTESFVKGGRKFLNCHGSSLLLCIMLSGPNLGLTTVPHKHLISLVNTKYR